MSTYLSILPIRRFKNDKINLALEEHLLRPASILGTSSFTTLEISRETAPLREYACRLFIASESESGVKQVEKILDKKILS